jgi:hypothetical protein
MPLTLTPRSRPHTPLYPKTSSPLTTTDGYTGTGNGDRSVNSGVSEGVKIAIPVPAAYASAWCYEAFMRQTGSQAREEWRVLVYDDDGTAGRAGTYLGSGYLASSNDAEAWKRCIFPEPFQLPASGSIWLLCCPQLTRSVRRHSVSQGVASAQRAYTSSVFAAQPPTNNPTDGGDLSSVFLEMSVYLVVYPGDAQPLTLGDKTIQPEQANTFGGHDIVLSRFTLSAAIKGKSLAELSAWASNAGLVNLNVVAYQDDGPGGLPGTLLGKAQMNSSEVGWYKQTLAAAFTIPTGSTYIYIGYEAPTSVEICQPATSPAVQRGWRYRTGLPAFSAGNPPASLSAYTPDASNSSNGFDIPYICLQYVPADYAIPAVYPSPTTYPGGSAGLTLTPR